MGPKRRGAAGGSPAKSEPGAASGRSKVAADCISNDCIERAFSWFTNSVICFSPVAEVCAEQQHTREEEGRQQLLGGNHQQNTGKSDAYSRCQVYCFLVLASYAVLQRGHDHEEEGKSNGSIQGIARRGNPKDYNVKLHGGTQGFEI